MAYTSQLQLLTALVIEDTEDHASSSQSVAGMDKALVQVTATKTSTPGDLGVTLSGSNDGTNWTDEDSATFSATGTAKLHTNEAWLYLMITATAVSIDEGDSWTVTAVGSVTYDYTGDTIGATAPSPANTIVVAKTGGDYSTIAAANTAAAAGDTIHVYDGTYAEQVTCKAGVSLKAMGENVIIQKLDAFPVVTLADDVNIDGFTVQGGPSAAGLTQQVIYGNGKSNINVTDCKVSGGNWGIKLNACTNVTVRGCEVDSPNGVYVLTGDNVKVLHCDSSYSGDAYHCLAQFDINGTNCEASHNHAALAAPVAVGGEQPSGYAIALSGAGPHKANHNDIHIKCTRPDIRGIQIFGTGTVSTEEWQVLNNSVTVESTGVMDKVSDLFIGPDTEAPNLDVRGNTVRMVYSGVPVTFDRAVHVDSAPSNSPTLRIDGGSVTKAKASQTTGYAISKTDGVTISKEPMSQAYLNVAAAASNALSGTGGPYDVAHFMEIYLDGNPDCCRALWLKGTDETAAGTVQVVGVGWDGATITENVTLNGTADVLTNNGFVSVTQINPDALGVGQFHCGVSNKLGLARSVAAAGDVQMASKGGAAPAAPASVDATNRTWIPAGCTTTTGVATGDDFVVWYLSSSGD